VPVSSETVMRVHVLVKGIVQGVFYRDFTQRQAEKFGLAGWVRNVRDGRVEAVAEGAAEDVVRWLSALRQGPSSSRVDEVEIVQDEAVEELDGFEVRY
jgi:acylphosphatase